MWKRLSSVFLVAALIAAALPFSVMAQEGDWLPAPTGPYQVGTSLFHWVDEVRDETFTDDPNDKRELVVQVWYPADTPADATPATYLPYGEIEAPYFDSLWRSGGLDLAQLAEELSRMPTHSYLDAPVSAAQPTYPVLIYSSGLPGIPVSATAQTEELASHGYIVAAIYHTYIAAWTVFPDGRVVTILPDPVFTQEMVEQTSVEVGAHDQVFTLDQLELLNESSANGTFAGHLDLEHVGTFGVSWGAWVTSMACLYDARFKAALIEQPHSFFPSAAYREGLDLPIMFMDPGRDSSTLAYMKVGGPAYKLAMPTMVGFGLSDFLLWPGFADQLQSWDRGTVEPARAVEIVNAYALAFFDQYLKGEESLLLDGPSPDYPEVNIESRNTWRGVAAPCSAEVSASCRSAEFRVELSRSVHRFWTIKSSRCSLVAMPRGVWKSVRI
jgi:predicted dienelactone hydrolase